MLDRKFIGYTSTPFTTDVERGRLRFFAKAIGETDLIYTDEEAARRAGHPDLPVPPTFFFCLEMDRTDPYGWFDDLGVELPKVLHGEQRFQYHRMAYAGDRLRFESTVVDIYDKKGGLLEFLVQDNRITNQRDERVAEFLRTIVIRHG